MLGGSSVRDSWESQPDPNLAVRIMKRAVDICPSSVPAGKGIETLSVIRHAVGLRPMRVEGIRIERELIRSPDGKPLTVVQNYGHGGAGYQTSYGAGELAVELIEQVFKAGARL